MTSLEEQKSNTDSVCVKVNKTHHTTITAWQSPKYDEHKEVVLHKEIEMSNTYRIIGADQDENNLNLSPNIGDDNDSFYGSDKETDDVLIFSEDEGQNEHFEDSSSSEDDLPPSKVIKINHTRYIKFCVYHCQIYESGGGQSRWLL